MAVAETFLKSSSGLRYLCRARPQLAPASTSTPVVSAQLREIPFCAHSDTKHTALLAGKSLQQVSEFMSFSSPETVPVFPPIAQTSPASRYFHLLYIFQYPQRVLLL